MHTPIRRALWMAALSIFAVGASFAAGPQSDQAPAAIIHMTINKQYVPKEVTISVGDTVEWVNDDPQHEHDVSTSKDETENPKAIELPKGAKPFSSGLMPYGKRWRHRFTVAGTYRYICLPHQPRMVGTIVVRPD